MIEPRLRGTVCRAQANGHFRLHAGNEHDFPTLPGCHVPGDELADMEPADECSADRAFEFIGTVIEECFASTVSRVADQDVDAARQREGFIDERFAPGPGKHIGGNRVAVASQRSDICCGLIENRTPRPIV